ncbi:hypothetical protein, partial [Streptococcus pasteurianus]|uniref:hypothetical protein n=1 Tax=Streptococcus pasteurianus TaxID=197614 RepID=UPI002283C0BC
RLSPSLTSLGKIANRIPKYEYFFKNIENNSFFNEFVSELNGIFLKIMVELKKYYFGGFS